ncbi:MAG: hypothetical protein GXY03_04765 [Solirubrobacterales bacterium]|nr:hypothetical protein [Solirubrobacterales bacterium]
MSSTAHGSDADDQATREIPSVDPAAAAAAAAAGPGAPGAPPLPEQDPFAEHPEYYVGAAFVGGLLAAQILKRLRR